MHDEALCQVGKHQFLEVAWGFPGGSDIWHCREICLHCGTLRITPYRPADGLEARMSALLLAVLVDGRLQQLSCSQFSCMARQFFYPDPDIEEALRALFTCEKLPASLSVDGIWLSIQSDHAGNVTS